MARLSRMRCRHGLTRVNWAARRPLASPIRPLSVRTAPHQGGMTAAPYDACGHTDGGAPSPNSDRERVWMMVTRRQLGAVSIAVAAPALFSGCTQQAAVAPYEDAVRDLWRHGAV